MMQAFSRLLGPMARRIRLLTARAVVTVINDALKMQGVQVKLLDGEVCDNVERFQNYGFTSHPLPGAEGIYLSIGGDRDHGAVIAVDDRRYRIKGLQSGEVAIYTDEGDSIVLKRGRLVEVNTQTFRINASTLVEINTPKVQMNAPLVATTGEIKADLDITDRNATTPKSMRGMRDVYNVHTHTDPQGGSVSTPTGQM
ncbi:MAG: phage baseplate assembly protein V [Burkholderiales bacterium]|nr:phage baseplate assembly protein V [Burkholderiales bacterium]